MQSTIRKYQSKWLNKDAKKLDEYFDKVRDLKVLDDDVWLVTLPKCGTTWMQELLWLLINDCNFEAALSEHLELRSPFMEYAFLAQNQDTLKAVEDLKPPRLIKTHTHLSLLPAQLGEKRAKIVYVFRNLKDAWVSSYYHLSSVGNITGKTLNEYVSEYIDKKAPLDRHIEHAYDLYQLRNEPWVYYTSFERMKMDLRGVIEDLSKFLNKSITDEQMQRLLKHLSFEQMKKNPFTNHLWEKSHSKIPETDMKTHTFIRRGKVNGYKDELTPELIEKADRFLEQQLQEAGVSLNELLLLNDA